jgi:hypothetical protein
VGLVFIAWSMGGSWNGLFMVGVVCFWRGWWLRKDIERMEAEAALLRREYGVLLRWRNGCDAFGYRRSSGTVVV